MEEKFPPDRVRSPRARMVAPARVRENIEGRDEDEHVESHAPFESPLYLRHFPGVLRAGMRQRKLGVRQQPAGGSSARLERGLVRAVHTGPFESAGAPTS